MIKLIFGLGRSLRLTPSSIFLAAMLSKQYIAKIDAKVPFSVQDEIAQTATLMGCKMRERDIYCPMISHISDAAGKTAYITYLRIHSEIKLHKEKRVKYG